MMTGSALDERRPHGVALQGGGRAKDPQGALGAGDGHVQAPHVGEEPHAAAATAAA